jgi:eukaryotic-like serine/threonine-protein kinase
LQITRAQKMTGDEASARKCYEDFLALWEDADPDVPSYQQAKAEYAKLRE